MIEKHYKNKQERQAIDAEMTAQGLSMVHDNFDTGTTKAGTMFYDVRPPAQVVIDPDKEAYSKAQNDTEKLDIVAQKLGLK